ncbi:MAG: DUF5131 family protein [Verrucomicrobiota bacterium]
MNDKTKIQWCDYTFNPWEGCTKVSAGCARCYAESRNKRWNKGEAINWGEGAPRRRTSVANWNKPLKWNQDAERFHYENGFSKRPRVFCASLADWLDDEVEIEWLRDLLDLIRVTPHLDWLLLTKRPECFHDRIQRVFTFSSAASLQSGFPAETASFISRWIIDGAPDNIWLGTSAEDQIRWDERVPCLMDIPAKVHFVSAEPLLGPIHMGGVRPDWLIVGGESGGGARSFEGEWAENLIEECAVKSVAFFMKQVGGNALIRGREFSTRHSKGGDPEEWPQVLRVREFPKVK